MLKKINYLIVTTFMFTILTAGFAHSAAMLPSFADLAKKAGAAVVNISTEKKVGGGGQFPSGAFRGLPPEFEKFFEQFNRGQGKPRTQRSLGTGFLISDDGYIVTNNHVVAEADKVFVNLQGTKGREESLTAEIIGRDVETDLALLKVSSKEKLPFLKFGDSDKMEVGEWVLAIGNPFGLGHTVTAGILSAKGRDIKSGPFDNYLQTDASINPGNSGGPLINQNAEVIGINTAIIASGQGIGFAIPSTMASNIIEQLKTNKKVSRGWIGVNIQDLDAETAKALNIKDSKGALIGGVLPNEPADKAGMKAGDVIVGVNNNKVTDTAELLKNIASLAPGTKAKVTVMRGGKQLELTVTLAERKVDGEDAPEKVKKQSSVLGISVRPLTEAEAKKLELKENFGLLVVDVDPSKLAAEAGIQAGDVLLTANLTPLKKSEDLAKILTDEGKKRGAITFQINRNGQTFFRTVALEDEDKEDK